MPAPGEFEHKKATLKSGALSGLTSPMSQTLRAPIFLFLEHHEFFAFTHTVQNCGGKKKIHTYLFDRSP